MLYVDVNLGQGEKIRIAMYEDSDPEAVARQFSKNHNLTDENLVSNLVGLLKTQMHQALTLDGEESN